MGESHFDKHGNPSARVSAARRRGVSQNHHSSVYCNDARQGRRSGTPPCTGARAAAAAGAETAGVNGPLMNADER
jgi:hypothetical protein